MALLPKLFKGLLYGSAVGMIFGVAEYLLAGAANGLFNLGVSPEQLGVLIFSTGVLAGVGMEYAKWLDGE